MKILFLSHQFHPFIGGIEVNSEILATEFSKAGHEVRLVTWTKDNNESKQFPFRVFRMPELIELMKLHAWCDIVFENNPCIRLSWPLLFLRKKNVVAVRTWVRRINGETGLQDKFKLFWLNYANRVIAISNSVRNQSCQNAIVIGNPYRSGLFKDLNIPRVKDFVFVGRLVSDKGADLAIKALFKLREKDKFNNQINLSIVGDGPEMSSLKSLVEQLNLESNVTFTGALRGDLLVQKINEHKFLLVPSLWEEPFGNVALEGLACGCIPIVSNGGGLPDAVGEAGLVFERGSQDDLVKKMEEIYYDEMLVAKLKRLSVDHLQNHLPEVVAQKYLEVIESARN